MVGSDVPIRKADHDVQLWAVLRDGSALVSEEITIEVR